MQADMVEHVARLAWDAGLPFMRKPLLRVRMHTRRRPATGAAAHLRNARLCARGPCSACPVVGPLSGPFPLFDL